MPSRTERWRPAVGGVSIGHFKITAGTLGVLAWRNRERVIVSNNHVLANANGGAAGDPVLQPGSYDNGRPEADTLARLEAFVPIRFEGTETPDQCPTARRVAALLNALCGLLGSQTRYRVVDARPRAEPNLVDAAVARPVEAVDPRLLGPENLPTVAAPTLAASAELGLPVRKSGRTTGWTEGRIAAVNVTARVQYGEGKIALFEDQVLIDQPGFAAGGDSGSAILSDAGELVGLLFAGSDRQTLFNRIEHVMQALDLSLAEGADQTRKDGRHGR